MLTISWAVPGSIVSTTALPLAITLNSMVAALPPPCGFSDSQVPASDLTASKGPAAAGAAAAAGFSSAALGLANTTTSNSRDPTRASTDFMDTLLRSDPPWWQNAI